MTIRQLINAEIEKLREEVRRKTAILVIFDSPNPSVAEKTEAMNFLLDSNPSLLAGFFELTKKPVSREKSDPVVSPVVAVAAPEPVMPSSVPTATMTAPARVLVQVQQRETPEQRRGSWLKSLSAFLAGKRINLPKTCDDTTLVFRSGISLTREHWEIFFATMKEMANKGLYILNDKANPDKVFAAAPSDLVSNFVFGQDGLMVTVMAGIGELKGSKITHRLVAQTKILVAAITAIENQMDDEMLCRITNLLSTVEEVDDSDRLAGEIRCFLPNNGPLAGGLRGLKNLREIAKPAPIVTEEKALAVATPTTVN